MKFEDIFTDEFNRLTRLQKIRCLIFLFGMVFCLVFAVFLPERLDQIYFLIWGIFLNIAFLDVINSEGKNK